MMCSSVILKFALGVWIATHTRLHVTDHVAMILVGPVCVFYYVPCVSGCASCCHLIGISLYAPNRGLKQYLHLVKVWV